MLERQEKNEEVIFKALDYPMPKFAHLPMITGSDKSRLSKRHGATSVQEYRRKGYLSDALVNYLALLGWSLDGKTEFFTRESLAKRFSLKGVSKNPAAFDPDKLDFIDGEHFKRLELTERAAYATWVTVGPGLVRAPRGGDRMVPLGGVGRRKVRRLLMEARIPAAERDRFPVVVRGDEVLWVPGVCRAAAAVPQPGEAALRLEARGPGAAG